MREVIPLYFATLDGEQPCAWSPFGVPMRQMQDCTKEIMQSKYSNSKHFSVSILCEKHEAIPDEALSQTIGCLIDAKYLKPEKRRYIDGQFVEFSNRLDREKIAILGFEIYIVASDQEPECDLDRAMEFKDRLILAGFDPDRLRVDVVSDQACLTKISKLRLVNIRHMQKAISLPMLKP
ncbi:hypothetical protein [Bradyrhizobium oligotrophicum]|uniref:hypothetical protein n=1 Tax=Bradyrhizobium oligotrophicum TaxID=44255 RepID=UPI003EBD5435